MLPRRRFHRITFLCAGIYNIVWGSWVALDPHWLFRFAEMEAMRYPELYVCIGMIVGIYGILYLEVARRPESGWLMAAVGLLGKILGPAGWLVAVSSGAWAPASGVLILTNDLIWWIPMALYLRDAWPLWRATWNPRASESGSSEAE